MFECRWCMELGFLHVHIIFNLILLDLEKDRVVLLNYRIKSSQLNFLGTDKELIEL